jgi:hypothetical protein
VDEGREVGREEAELVVFLAGAICDYLTSKSSSASAI